MQRRPRFAVLCLAIVVVAALVPFAPAVLCAIDLSSYAIEADAPVQKLARTLIRCDEQPLSFLAVVPLRGPPSHDLLA